MALTRAQIITNLLAVMSSNQSELDSLTAKTALAEEIADSIIGGSSLPDYYYTQNLTTTNTLSALLVRDSITEDFDGSVYEIEFGGIVTALTNSSSIELNLKLTDSTSSTSTLISTQTDDILNKKTFRSLKYITTLTGTNTIFVDFRRVVAGSSANISFSYITIKKVI
jgi:hypothetical protein